MGADEMEVLLRRCRPPQPPAAVERRVMEEARGVRKSPSRALAVAAVLLFAAVLFAVVSRERPSQPGGARPRIRQWTYTCREAGAVVAVLSADEAEVQDGAVTGRAFSAKLFSSKGEPITIRADRGRFDPKDPRLTLDGAVRIDRVDGFSSAAVDLREKSWTATTDLAGRFATSTKSAPEKYQPRTEIEGRSARSSDTETTITPCSLKLSAPGWTFQVSGSQGRSDRATTTVTGGVWAIFEDGSTLQAQEAHLGNSTRTLRLKGKFE